jgi:hypothetical protein
MEIVLQVDKSARRRLAILWGSPTAPIDALQTATGRLLTG